MTVHNTDEIERLVREFLAAAEDGPEPGADEDLFQSGRMDSLFALQLVNFTERTFDIEVDVDELDLAAFATIAKITEFVANKQTAAQSV
ncbi:acyl carrier protein [Streptomyces botrytidirepellens]|nr:phosphopantetheine-binding protein [Streptomyces botrytidirepellens]